MRGRGLEGVMERGNGSGNFGCGGGCCVEEGGTYFGAWGRPYLLMGEVRAFWKGVCEGVCLCRRGVPFCVLNVNVDSVVQRVWCDR